MNIGCMSRWDVVAENDGNDDSCAGASRLLARPSRPAARQTRREQDEATAWCSCFHSRRFHYASLFLTLQPRYNAHSVITLIGRWIPLNNATGNARSPYRLASGRPNRQSWRVGRSKVTAVVIYRRDR